TMTLNSLGAASSSGTNIDNGGLRYDPASTGSATFNPAITLTGTSGIHVENAANTLTMASVISGSGFGVTKTGAGNMILNAANTYSGTTTITGGTLTLASTGSIANSSTIHVQSGATYNVSAVSGYSVGASQTIKGSGTVVGAMTVAGTVAPGTAAGTLTANGAVTMQNSSVFAWDLNNPSPGVGAQNTGNSDSAGLQD